MWICPCLHLEADLDIGGIGVFLTESEYTLSDIVECCHCIHRHLRDSNFDINNSIDCLPEEPRTRLWENTGTPLDSILNPLESIRLKLRRTEYGGMVSNASF